MLTQEDLMAIATLMDKKLEPIKEQLKELEPMLNTDGDTWYIQYGGIEREEIVQEPRMAALYNCGLRRYCGRG